MTKKGFEHTKETKKKISESNKGKHYYWRGKKRTKETKNKIGKANALALKGRKLSEKTKKRLSETHKGLNTWMKGRKFSKETREKMSKTHSGKKSYLWKGGTTPENKRIRNSIEFRLWREAVFARDNWICQKSGIKGGKLHPHHIKNFAEFPELRFAIDNGITLSEKAHKEFHKKYGYKNNTKEQLNEF